MIDPRVQALAHRTLLVAGVALAILGALTSSPTIVVAGLLALWLFVKPSKADQ